MGRKLGNTSAAVMAQRAPKEVEEKEDADPRAPLWRILDFYPTPPWGTRAGAELVQMLDPGARVLREPCCGEGHMVGPLSEYFEVIPSDVHPHTGNTPVMDWLDDAAWPDEPDCDWIFTNPPFGIAEEFVTRGLKRARRGVALLVRLAFLESDGRYEILGDGRLTLLAIFSERLPMVLGKWDVKARSATGYAWLFWMKDADPRAPVWIKPGSKARLSHRTDAERYGWRPPLPLFEYTAEVV